MPEEINRILVDHASDLLLAPTNNALLNLVNEGLEARSIVVGDVMTDICYRTRDSLMGEKEITFETDDKYVLATIHRAVNTDNEILLKKIVTNLQALPLRVKLVAHPRLVKAAQNFEINLNVGSIEILNPVSYREMISLIIHSQGVITDSGGLQKEAYLLERVCTTIRSETEWIETLKNGWNILDPEAESLREFAFRTRPNFPGANFYGLGDASLKSIEAMINFN
jgi:UDP-N-acetylglucosamine 2-epimerase (non-hydrolysing)